ncbi:unnamed protein product [Diabrotica balteata]|uniref:DUF4371 domain-containing protein n=1 Tax=Diabrotica balteata TaxID=107213 RepID=A0A9N9XFF4_DIABA|nr:unnamed protein product [Diabrotica balteata]
MHWQMYKYASHQKRKKKYDLECRFCEVSNTTGQGLTDLILNFLKESKINTADKRGQGYDYGANMKGKHNDLQKKILVTNPRALFCLLCLKPYTALI